MTEGTPEGAPLTPEEFRQLNRDLMEAGFPEAERLRVLQAHMEAQEAEVVGQEWPGGVVPTIAGIVCNWR